MAAITASSNPLPSNIRSFVTSTSSTSSSEDRWKDYNKDLAGFTEIFNVVAQEASNKEARKTFENSWIKYDEAMKLDIKDKVQGELKKRLFQEALELNEKVLLKCPKIHTIDHRDRAFYLEVLYQQGRIHFRLQNFAQAEMAFETMREDSAFASSDYANHWSFHFDLGYIKSRQRDYKEEGRLLYRSLEIYYENYTKKDFYCDIKPKSYGCFTYNLERLAELSARQPDLAAVFDIKTILSQGLKHLKEVLEGEPSAYLKQKAHELRIPIIETPIIHHNVLRINNMLSFLSTAEVANLIGTSEKIKQETHKHVFHSEPHPDFVGVFESLSSDSVFKSFNASFWKFLSKRDLGNLEMTCKRMHLLADSAFWANRRQKTFGDLAWERFEPTARSNKRAYILTSRLTSFNFSLTSTDNRLIQLIKLSSNPIYQRIFPNFSKFLQIQHREYLKTLEKYSKEWGLKTDDSIKKTESVQSIEIESALEAVKNLIKTEASADIATALLYATFPKEFWETDDEAFAKIDRAGQFLLTESSDVNKVRWIKRLMSKIYAVFNDKRPESLKAVFQVFDRYAKATGDYDSLTVQILSRKRDFSIDKGDTKPKTRSFLDSNEFSEAFRNITLALQESYELDTRKEAIRRAISNHGNLLGLNFFSSAQIVFERAVNLEEPLNLAQMQLEAATYVNPRDYNNLGMKYLRLGNIMKADLCFQAILRSPQFEFYLSSISHDLRFPELPFALFAGVKKRLGDSERGLALYIRARDAWKKQFSSYEGFSSYLVSYIDSLKKMYSSFSAK